MGEGSEDWKIVDRLEPSKGDLVLRKNTPSFFIGTFLEQILRSRGVETLILCGVTTEVGIEGTARHAGYLGFLPVIVEDAVGSFDPQIREKALDIMRRMFEVRTTHEVVTKLNIWHGPAV